jgi:hypothetical protein
MIGHRFVHVTDETRCQEVLIVYNADLRDTGHTAAELDDPRRRPAR